MDVLLLFISVLYVILIDSSTGGSPVHVSRLSIQAVRGLPRLRAPGIVPCIISPGTSLVFSWCDHSLLAFLFWRCLTVPSLLQLCSELNHLFSLLSTKPAESFSVLSSQRRQDVFLHSFGESSFHSRRVHAQKDTVRQKNIKPLADLEWICAQCERLWHRSLLYSN